MPTINSGVTTPITLLEYAKTMEEGSATRIFVENMVKDSDLLAAMPFLPATAGKREFMDIADVPSVGFRGINQAGGEATGHFNLRSEDTFFIDEYVKTDRALIDRLGPDHESRQVELKTIALSQMVTSKIIKGDNASSQVEPNGLQVRCTNLIANAGTGGNLLHNSVASGGAALSLLNLDILYACVNKPTHWVFPRGLRPYLDQAARSSTLTNAAVMYSNERDPLGRMVLMYKGLPILFGYEPDDTPDMLPFTEVGQGGGAAVTSSIYCVSLREGGFYAIEQVSLSVEDEGMIKGIPFKSTHIKWDWGTAREHPRSIARLTSITAATIVA